MIFDDNLVIILLIFFIKTYVLGAQAILMSTHNIGFYEDLTKIIFELSSNIIKYAPYFFCCDTLKWLLFSILLSICLSMFLSQPCIEFQLQY